MRQTLTHPEQTCSGSVAKYNHKWPLWESPHKGFVTTHSLQSGSLAKRTLVPSPMLPINLWQTSCACRYPSSTCPPKVPGASAWGLPLLRVESILVQAYHVFHRNPARWGWSTLKGKGVKSPFSSISLLPLNGSPWKKSKEQKKRGQGDCCSKRAGSGTITTNPFLSTAFLPAPVPPPPPCPFLRLPVTPSSAPCSPCPPSYLLQQVVLQHSAGGEAQQDWAISHISWLELLKEKRIHEEWDILKSWILKEPLQFLPMRRKVGKHLRKWGWLQQRAFWKAETREGQAQECGKSNS